jgi:CheY-like chemotaxis protein
MVLKNFGHDVHVAHDGASALLIAPEIDPHVILMDIGLPGMDGYGVAREMMKIPALQNTTLVALTGYGQEKDREKAFASGFSHHFIKPVEIHDLNNFLKRIEVF